MLPINKVKPNIKNPRKGQYDETEMDELQDSISAYGQLTAIKVDKDYVILGGHRRHFAMKNLVRNLLKLKF